MRIAIAGAGITGTTVGFLLAEQGHEVTIFEQAKVCQPVGAGIMLQNSGQQVLDRLGLLADLATASEELTGMTAMHVSGRNLVQLDFSKLGDEYFALGVHRGNLFEVLLNRCISSGVTIRNDQQITRYDEANDCLETETGERFDGFDFVIAADGSRSRLRESTGIRCRVTEYDHAAIWTTGACDFQPGQLFQFVQGTRRLAGLLPIGNGHSSFFWGLPANEWPKLRNTSLDTWKQEVRKFCPQSESILDQIESFEQMRFGTYRNVAMSKWNTDRVVFLGDAAHATSPHLGQGVNLALEDAYCFAESIKQTGKFKTACEVYSKKRTSKLRYYQQLTKLLSPFFQSNFGLLAFGRNFALPWLPSIPFVGREMLRTLSGQKDGWLR